MASGYRAYVRDSLYRAPASAPPSHQVACCGDNSVPSDSFTPLFTEITHSLLLVSAPAITAWHFKPTFSETRFTKDAMACMVALSVPS